MNDTLRELVTAVIGLVVLAGCGLLIFTSRGSEEQAWLMVGVVCAYFFNRQQQASAVRDVMASQPTVVSTSGPPPTTTVSHDPPLTQEQIDRGDYA